MQKPPRGGGDPPSPFSPPPDIFSWFLDQRVMCLMHPPEWKAGCEPVFSTWILDRQYFKNSPKVCTRSLSLNPKDAKNPWCGRGCPSHLFLVFSRFLYWHVMCLMHPIEYKAGSVPEFSSNCIFFLNLDRQYWKIHQKHATDHLVWTLKMQTLLGVGGGHPLLHIIFRIPRSTRDVPYASIWVYSMQWNCIFFLNFG